MQTALGRLSGIWERTKRKRKQNTEFAGCARRCTGHGTVSGGTRGQRGNKITKYLKLVISQSSQTIAESFSKEQLTGNASTILSVSKYQRNNFHYFQTTGTTGTLLEILSEHTPETTEITRTLLEILSEHTPYILYLFSFPFCV